MIREAIQRLLESQTLTATEAETVMDEIMRGEATPAQIAGFLIALRSKGETVAEITGCARAMRRAARQIHPKKAQLIDTCGTGGDGAGTFNISTTSAFVVAGAGLAVAKHGNRSVSSRCGSADVLEALGANLELSPEKIAMCIDEVGIGFLFAPRLHPAMRFAIGPRRELGVRTIFNILGPLTNPAQAEVQLLGVYDAQLTSVMAHVLRELGSKGAYVVHGYGGVDELTTAGPNHVSFFGVGGADGEVITETLDPQALGFPQAGVEALKGGDAAENAHITRAILSGEERGPRRDVVLLNAAAALLVGGRAQDLREGIEIAKSSIDSGAAYETLQAFITFTQRVGAEAGTA